MPIFQKLFLTFLLGLVFLAPVRADEISDAIEAGNNFFALGNYQLAIQQYRNAALWPGKHQALVHYNLGVCQERLNQKNEAVREYQTAIAAHQGRYINASRALGFLLADLNRWDEAKAAFEQAIKAADGREPESLFQLAMILARTKNFEAATEKLQLAIKHGGKNFPGGHNNMGVLLAIKGKFSEALREFDLAIKQSKGNSAEAAHNLQLCRRLLDSAPAGLLARLQTSTKIY